MESKTNRSLKDWFIKDTLSDSPTRTRVRKIEIPPQQLAYRYLYEGPGSGERTRGGLDEGIGPVLGDRGI